jgi:hypothetical protein
MSVTACQNKCNHEEHEEYEGRTKHIFHGVTQTSLVGVTLAPLPRTNATTKGTKNPKLAG